MKDKNLLELNSPREKIGIVGLGGLGHVALNFVKAFDHLESVINTSPSKERLGAADFVLSTKCRNCIFQSLLSQLMELCYKKS